MGDGSAKRSVSFRLDEDLLARVDAARGSVDRTSFVAVALESLLDAWPPQVTLVGANEPPGDALSGREPDGSSTVNLRALPERQPEFEEEPVTDDAVDPDTAYLEPSVPCERHRLPFVKSYGGYCRLGCRPPGCVNR